MNYRITGYQNAFTLPEVVVIVTVIGILVTASILGMGGPLLSSARDKERAQDIDTIARQLEHYYRVTTVSLGATYPPSTTTQQALITIIGSSDATTAPNGNINSLTIATTNASQTPTLNTYVYQPLNVDGTLCSTTPCVRFALYYRQESDSSIVRKDSMRQQ